MLFELSRDLARNQEPTSHPELRKGIERCAQELQGSTCLGESRARPRTPVRLNLTGRSALASKANRRTDAFEAEYLRPLSPGFARPSSARGEAAGDGTPSQVRQAHSKYRELVTGIEAAMHGGVVPAVAHIHIGELVVERLSAHGRRHFELTLPTQPMNVIVQLSCTDGASPLDLYASTATERPSARHHELKASKAGELIYSHDIDTDAADSAALTLHLTVESRESCEFSLKSAARRVPRRLEPSEARIAMLATKSHASVHKKLETLRKDPQARKKLDQRVASLNKQRRSREKDFSAMNQAKVQEYAPERREALAITNAGLQNERLQLATQRREVVQKEMETRMITLANRDKDRKAARAAEVQKLDDEAIVKELRLRWLEKLAVVSYGVHLYNMSLAAKLERVRELRQQQASRTIQFFCMAVLTKRRREALYVNAMRFRCGVVAFARTVMPALASMAKPKVKWFLSVHSLNRPDVSVVSMIKRFLGWVRLVQRSYRRIRMIRSARVEALLPHFLARELLKPAAAAVVLPVGGGESAQGGKLRPQQFSSSSASRSPKIRGSVFNHKGSPSPRKSTSVQGHRSSRVTNSPRKSFAVPRSPQPGRVSNAPATSFHMSEPEHPAFAEYIRQGEDPLRDCLRKHVMRQHVVEMQKSLPDRVRAWQDRKKANMLEELRMVGLASKALEQEIGQRPRAVEVSRLRDLYVETFDKMKAGGFKHFFHDRRRLLKTSWSTWKRKVTYGSELPVALARKSISSMSRRFSHAGAAADLTSVTRDGSLFGPASDTGQDAALPEFPRRVHEELEDPSGSLADGATDAEQPTISLIAPRDGGGTSRPSSARPILIPNGLPLEPRSLTGTLASARMSLPENAFHQSAADRPSSASLAASPSQLSPRRPKSAKETQIRHSIFGNRAVSKAFGL